jgi:hypothetical protein
VIGSSEIPMIIIINYNHQLHCTYNMLRN